MTREMVWRAEAADLLLELRESFLTEQRTESIVPADVAGRTLATDLVAERNQPPVSRSTMDGYAFDATDDYPLALREEKVFPEDEPPTLASGEAIRIFTGAPLPAGANAVLKQEQAVVEDGRLRGDAIVPGTYMYERGSNVSEGERLFEGGERLTPKDTLLLGDLGYDTVAVHDRFDVALLATGTEIHEGRQRDLDSPMLAGLVQSWGHRPTHEGTVPDEYRRVRDRIADLADDYDVVVTTGGTSVGDKDHVVRALDALGEVLFHRVRIRPGKPLAVARLPDHGAVAVAVPGKPVGAHAVTTLVARSFFSGETVLPTLSTTLTADVGIDVSGFEYAVPVLLDGEEATPLGHAESPLSVYDETFDPSVLSSSTRASRADGFFLTESDRAAGDDVAVVPYAMVE